MKLADLLDVYTYYVFLLADKLYAIEIERIGEVKVGYDKVIYPISGFKSSLAGVIDSGGEEVPVLDLSSILMIEQPSNQPENHTIIIVEMMRNKQKKKCGLLVNSCLNITNITTQDAFPVSLFEPYVKKYFASKTSGHKEMIKILDIDALWEKFIFLYQGY